MSTPARGVAATRLHGISTRHPRCRRDTPPAQPAAPIRRHTQVIRTLIHHLDRRPSLEGGDAELQAELSQIDIPYATPLVYTYARSGGAALRPFSDSTQLGIIRGTFLT